MRIGIYDPYLDTMGGGEKYMLSLARFLSEKNEVFLFWKKEEELKIKEKAKNRFNLDLEGIKFTDNIFSSKTCFLSRILISRKYDCLIYLSDGSLPFLLAKKFIVHFQFPVQWVRTNFLTKIKLQRINKVICNSEFTKKFIDKKFDIKSLVIYPPCDLANSNKNTKENIVLTVGRFNKTKEGRNFKKHDFLIEVFKKMADKGFSDWKFYILISFREQESEEVNKLEKTVGKYPIYIFKNVKDPELKTLYSKAKIYWHASGFGEDLSKNPELAEHFGMSTVEAMSFGAVPVVINAGGQREIVDGKENGFLWNSEIELIEKTSILMKNEELLQKMSKEAIKKSSVFGTGVFNQKIKELIEL